MHACIIVKYTAFIILLSLYNTCTGLTYAIENYAYLNFLEKTKLTTPTTDRRINNKTTPTTAPIVIALSSFAPLPFLDLSGC